MTKSLVAPAAGLVCAAAAAVTLAGMPGSAATATGLATVVDFQRRHASRRGRWRSNAPFNTRSSSPVHSTTRIATESCTGT